MKTIRHLYVREYREDKIDNFLNELTVDLTTEQEEYLKANRSMDRPQLFKLFKKKFNSPINKIQFNFALAKVKGDVPRVVKIPPSKQRNFPRPDVTREKNVQWITETGVWEVKFKKHGKSKSLGRYMDFEQAVKVASEYRQKLA